MTEAQLYHPDGLFHEIVKRSKIMRGRYHILPNGTSDLNTNSLKGVELPDANGDYPLVACLAPRSTLEIGGWEKLSFRILFLDTTESTGDNKPKGRDHLTNTSTHKVYQDWQDMKRVATAFVSALVNMPTLLSKAFVDERAPIVITRITEIEKAKVSGVMLEFRMNIADGCMTDNVSDIDVGDMPNIFPDHVTHDH